MKKIFKILVAIVGGVLMPVLIWITLGVVLHQKLQTRKYEKRIASINEILKEAGLSLHKK